jgi:hypothetical protein
MCYCYIFIFETGMYLRIHVFWDTGVVSLGEWFLIFFKDYGAFVFKDHYHIPEDLNP